MFTGETCPTVQKQHSEVPENVWQAKGAKGGKAYPHGTVVLLGVITINDTFASARHYHNLILLGAVMLAMVDSHPLHQKISESSGLPSSTAIGFIFPNF